MDAHHKENLKLKNVKHFILGPHNGQNDFDLEKRKIKKWLGFSSFLALKNIKEANPPGAGSTKSFKIWLLLSILELH